MKVQFWIIAMACGALQALQGMANGSAARSLGAIWTGAFSASVSMAALALTALAVYRLPFPDAGLLLSQGPKTIVGGLMGGFIVAGVAFVAPRLGPTQTFLLYFLAIMIASLLIDGLGLLGTEARPPTGRQLAGVLIAGLGLLIARA